MKYGLPTDDDKTVGKVFGRAKSFAIYDNVDGSLTILANEGANSEHGAGTGAVAFLVERGIDAVVAPELGPKATETLKAAGVRIESAKAGTVLGEAAAGINNALGGESYPS